MNAQVELFNIEDESNDVIQPENALEQTNFVEVLVEQYNKQAVELDKTIALLNSIDSTSARILDINGAVLKPALNSEKLHQLLKIDFWNTVYIRSNIRDYLDSEKRTEWQNKLHVNKENKAELPEFNIENVSSTLKNWYQDRESMFMDRVDLVFRSLSKSHVTNQPEGFSKKLIFSNGCEMNFRDTMNIGYQTADKIHDLECIICMLTNRPLPSNHSIYRRQDLALGMKHSFLGDSYQVQVFKSGTIHIWIHPSIAIDLNIWLAKKYPTSIPSKHRVKSKAIKEYTYCYDSLNGADVQFLERIISGYGVKFEDKGAIERFKHFANVDDVELDKARHERSYETFAKARIVLRNGYPNVKSHQFYPTPDNIVHDVKEYLGSRIEDDSIKVLEPSAGTGNLASLFIKETVTCVEVNQFFAEVLNVVGFKNVVQADFLKFKSSDKFDLVVMNPPYSEKRLELHLEHALNFLSNEGEMVLVAPTGKRSKIEEIAQGYTVSLVKDHKNEFEHTSISTAIFSITKN